MADVLGIVIGGIFIVGVCIVLGLFLRRLWIFLGRKGNNTKKEG